MIQLVFLGRIAIFGLSGLSFLYDILDLLFNFFQFHVSSDGLEKDVKFAYTKRATAILIKEIERLLELIGLLFVKPGLLRLIDHRLATTQSALCL